MLKDTIDHEYREDKRNKHDYKQYLDQQVNYVRGKVSKVNELPIDKSGLNSNFVDERRRQNDSPLSEHMVPGIHNMASVGTKPLMRGAIPHQIPTLQPRDNVYHQIGAGQTSSKVNVRWELPSMLTQKQQEVMGYQRHSTNLSPNRLNSLPNKEYDAKRKIFESTLDVPVRKQIYPMPLNDNNVRRSGERPLGSDLEKLEHNHYSQLNTVKNSSKRFDKFGNQVHKKDIK
jgi:hypothetical protein